MLSPDQIQELFGIIQKHQLVFIGQHIGEEYLSSEEKQKLKSLGIDTSKMYLQSNDFILQQYYFGLLSDAMGNDAKKLDYKELRAHFTKGKYIPLTRAQKYSINSIKNQFLGDITANGNKIFTDVNGVIQANELEDREAYERVLRTEIERGYINKKTYNETARDIARMTGDWSRNFGRIVEYVSHAAFNEGRVASFEKEKGETYIYFDVYEGACKHCIRLYLTAGLGSKPRKFTLSELRANGNNIGRKTADWKATIYPIHPFCRCTANEWLEDLIWDEEKRRFVKSKEIVIQGRKGIRVEIGGKEYLL